MAVLLILGNGFDLHCGLKSRFADFLDFELKKEEVNLLYSHLQKDLLLSNRNRNTLEPSYYSVLDAGLSLSAWEVCFLVLKALYGTDSNPSFETLTADWKDVEKMIRTSLTEEEGALFSVPAVFTFLYNHFHQTRLLGESKTIDSRVEWIIANFISFSPRFAQTDFGVEKSVSRSRAIFYSYLFKELNIFEKSFGDYISDQESHNQDYNERARLLVSRLCEGTPDVVVESFNYTRPNITCQGFRNIHGTTENPVIGIDADGIDKDDPRYQFTKASRCLMLAIQDEELTKQDFNTVTNIIIYGHSLNAQDYTYFFNILETKRIQDPSNICEITFPYSVYPGTKKKIEQQRVHDAAGNLLNSYDQWTGHRLSTVESLYFQKKYHFKEVQ